MAPRQRPPDRYFRRQGRAWTDFSVPISPLFRALVAYPSPGGWRWTDRSSGRCRRWACTTGHISPIIQLRQVVRCESEKQLPGQFRQTYVMALSQATYGPDPVKGLFDHPAPPEAQGIALSPRRAIIHRAACALARHLGLDPQALHAADEVLGVLTLVGAHRRTRLNAVHQHGLGRLPFGPAVGLGGHKIHHQPVPVLVQGVGHQPQLRFGKLAVLVQPRVWVGAGFVGGLATRCAFEIDFGVPPGRPFGPAAVLLHEACVAGPSFDERAVHAEVLVRDEVLSFGQVQHPVEECPSQGAVKQSVAVDANNRAITGLIVHTESGKPAEQQIVSIRTISCRSKRMLKRICCNSARSSYSGGPDPPV